MIHFLFLTLSKINKLVFVSLVLAGTFFIFAGKIKATDSTKIPNPAKSQILSTLQPQFYAPTYLLMSGKSQWNTEKQSGQGTFIKSPVDGKNYVYYRLPSGKTCITGYDPVFLNSVYYSRPMSGGRMMGIYNSLKLVALGNPPSFYGLWGRVFETDSDNTDTLGISWQIWCTRSDLGSVVVSNDGPAPAAFY